MARWIDRFLVDDAVSWGQSGEGKIIWYDSPAFGEEVAKALNAPLPRSESELDLNGKTLVLSKNIFGTGLDGLQFKYHRALYTWVPNAQDAEQVTGRLAREGQTQPVGVEIYAHTPELETALDETIEVARTLEEREGQAQLLLMGIGK